MDNADARLDARILMYSRCICRSAAKLLHMDPLADQSVVPQPLGSHASLGALLAWRFTQLLAARPNRDTEVAAGMQTADGLIH